MMQHRHAALPQFLPPDAAVERALALPGGPIILVNSADNIGGGTPGDGTDALRAMLAADVQEGAVVLADREAVAACWDAGVGAEVSLLVGGKTDRWHGEPVAVTGMVRALSDGVFACELPDNHFAVVLRQHHPHGPHGLAARARDQPGADRAQDAAVRPGAAARRRRDP